MRTVVGESSAWPAKRSCLATTPLGLPDGKLEPTIRGWWARWFGPPLPTITRRTELTATVVRHTELTATVRRRLEVTIIVARC